MGRDSPVRARLRLEKSQKPWESGCFGSPARHKTVSYTHIESQIPRVSAGDVVMVTTFSYMTWNMYKCTNEGIATRGMSCRLWKGARKPCGRFCLTPHCDVEYSVVQGQNQPQVSTEETARL